MVFFCTHTHTHTLSIPPQRHFDTVFVLMLPPPPSPPPSVKKSNVDLSSGPLLLISVLQVRKSGFDVFMKDVFSLYELRKHFQ